jgi:hypothetical protein
MDHPAHGRVEDEEHGVGDGVRHRERAHGEGAQLQGRLVHGQWVEQRGQLLVVLGQARAHEPQRVGGAEHGDLVARQQIGEGADVVLVPVGEDDAAQAAADVQEG